LKGKRVFFIVSWVLASREGLSWVTNRYTAMQMRSIITGRVNSATVIHQVIWAMLVAICLTCSSCMSEVWGSGVMNPAKMMNMMNRTNATPVRIRLRPLLSIFIALHFTQ
jgi:hypothetical protein